MSEFKNSIFRIIKSVPKGRVVSYSQVAFMAGVPRAARQVGWFLFSSGEEIPWWRVLNNAGMISIKNPECPQELQKKLLESEGVFVSTSKDTNTFHVDMKKYRYLPSSADTKKLGLSDEEAYALMEKYNM